MNKHWAGFQQSTSHDYQDEAKMLRILGSKSVIGDATESKRAKYQLTWGKHESDSAGIYGEFPFKVNTHKYNQVELK